MTAMLIRCFKPNVTRERAVAMLRQPLREWRVGRLRLATDFYLPYRLFRMTLDDGRRARDLLMAVDAVTGGLDPYSFDEFQPDQLVELETDRVASGAISETQALAQLEERLTRQAFLKGVFKLGELKISGEQIAAFYLPYWIGVYERNDRPHLEVIDAVRGRFEGAKVREIVTAWFG